MILPCIKPCLLQVYVLLLWPHARLPAYFSLTTVSQSEIQSVTCFSVFPCEFWAASHYQHLCNPSMCFLSMPLHVPVHAYLVYPVPQHCKELIYFLHASSVFCVSWVPVLQNQCVFQSAFVYVASILSLFIHILFFWSYTPFPATCF